MGDQRGDHTWHEGGIVHDADTHHLHGEDGGCHRSAEQRGKRSAHTAHDHDVLVLLIKMKQTSQTVSNTAAELQGSTLTAGRTAEQVGDQRRDKNERRHAQRQFIAGMDGGEYKVCAGIALIVKQAVGTYNENTSDRKQENKPRIFCADESDKSHAQIKKCAHRSDQHTGEDGEYHPFQGSL